MSRRCRLHPQTVFLPVETQSVHQGTTGGRRRGREGGRVKERKGEEFLQSYCIHLLPPSRKSTHLNLKGDTACAWTDFHHCKLLTLLVTRPEIQGSITGRRAILRHRVPRRSLRRRRLLVVVHEHVEFSVIPEEGRDVAVLLLRFRLQETVRG